MRGAIRKTWLGHERLGKVFWYYAFLGSIALSVISDFIFKIADSAGTRAVEVLITLPAVATLIAYSVWIAVAIWRCAPNTEKVLWGMLGRGYAIMQAVWTAYWLLEMLFEIFR